MTQVQTLRTENDKLAAQFEKIMKEAKKMVKSKNFQGAALLVKRCEEIQSKRLYNGKIIISLL